MARWAKVFGLLFSVKRWSEHTGCWPMRYFQSRRASARQIPTLRVLGGAVLPFTCGPAIGAVRCAHRAAQCAHRYGRLLALKISSKLRFSTRPNPCLSPCVVYRSRLGTLGLLLGLSFGCGAEPGTPLGTTRQGVVYGEDDRVDLIDSPDERFRRMGDWIGGLLDSEYAEQQSDGNYVLTGPVLSDRYELCPGEPWVNEPSLAHCTALLVDESTLLTAGHCVDPESLDDVLFVRSYQRNAGYPKVSAQRVHRLKRVLARRDGDIASASGDDFALVELETKAELAPVVFAEHPERPSEGRAVVVVGTSEGLPLKIDAGGVVYDASARDYFEITSDTFQGGSGSAVFSASGEFWGIVVGGVTDYSWDDERQCQMRRRLDAPLARGELVVRVPVLDAALAIVRSGRRSEPKGCAISAGPRAPGSMTAFFAAVLVVLGVRRTRAKPLR